ncbi:Aliphatic sulfonates import ATP-binding protein SsuB [compost metagenome]
MKQGLEIHIKDLSKTFNTKEVIKNMTLDIQASSFVSILGPSGCGKSTLLRLIAGLETPTSGEVILDGNVPGRFSFVFQEANLLPWRTVAENVQLPFELDAHLNLPELEIHKRVKEVLGQVQLAEAADLFPHELSGGMKMRVSLARALVSRPRLLLMDEPFAALDEATRFSMQDLLRDLWTNEKMTVVFVTHSVFESVYLSERIVRMGAPKGRIDLDMVIDLPEERTGGLRTSEALNKIAAVVSNGGQP